MTVFPIRLISVFVISALTTLQVASADLTVGSKAPQLDIEHWLSNDNGKFAKVKEFQRDKVYVVEFWATWCGPCVASMPHLVKLQKQYADQGVQIISVSDEDLDTVKQFLQRPVANSKNEAEGKNQTFAELTASYCLTTDPDQSVYRDYMEASGEGGIPTAFIVGKDGLIEWIGHPMEMDEPLAQIVDGKWDRQRYLKKLQEQKAIEAGIQEVFALLQNNSSEKALKKIEQLIESTSDADLKAGLAGFKISVLIEINPTEAAKQMRDLIGKTKAAEGLNGLAWSVVEAAQERQGLATEIIDAATEAAEKAVKLAPQDGAILDTLAHLLELKGEIDKAIQLQQKAVELSPNVPQLQSYLKQLQSKYSKAPEKRP